MTRLAPQPLPWTVLSNREIGDSAGNVVQYTIENLGAMVHAVNNHDKLVDTLSQVETWLLTPAASRASEGQILALISSATGRMGYGALAAKIEGASGPSLDLNRSITTELQLPVEADYTGSTDIAFSLIPNGWIFSMESQERLDPSTKQPAVYSIVTLKSGDKAVTAASLTLPLAISSAALKTKET